MKRCQKCKVEKPLAEFNRGYGNPDGYQYTCKACNVADQRERRQRRRAERGRTGGRGQATTVAVHPIEEFEITEVPPGIEAWLPEKGNAIEYGNLQRNNPPAPPIAGNPPEETKPASPAPVNPSERIEIARLRDDKRRLEGQLKEMEQQAVTADKLREMIGSLDAPNVSQSPEWLQGASKPRSVTGTPVLFLSDIHFDEVVAADQIGGCNEYNREIATQSIKNTFRSAISLLKSFMAAPKYDGIVAPLGGDLLSGNIHEELTKTNEFPIQKSMIAIEELLIEGLGGLADEFGKVHVPCVTGNHGRMSRKPEAKNRGPENYEWAIYQRLASYFRRDSRITFDIPEGPDAFFKVYERRFCLTHGDQFRGGNGIGGIMVPIKRGVAKKQQRQVAIGNPFDHVLMGHWHQYTHEEQIIINGSIKGYDEYAYANNFDYQPPQQALFIVHPEVGITFRMPVMSRYEGGRLQDAVK